MRDWVKQALIIAIIIFFVGEMVVVALPRTQENPSPTPQSSGEYSGYAIAEARIINFTQNLLVECNASDAEEALKSVKGMEDVFSLSKELHSAKINSSFDSREVVWEVYYTLLKDCAVKIFREPILEFTGQINLTSQSGEPKSIPGKLLSVFCSDQFKPCTKLVNAFDKANETVYLLAKIDFSGDSIVNAFVQEQFFEVPEPSPSPQANETNQTAGNESNYSYNESNYSFNNSTNSSQNTS